MSFPIPDEQLCERCTSIFATLDLADDVCHAIGDVKLPEAARRVLEERVLSRSG
ncbi:MAG: hypothetical protein OEO79_12500 [Gemmatimonadota bacterium]|nr:hypothetical protein [Gemmatimonadota bacterium]MDH3421732.1 hypothetical protein [Gemmatimonadota bacterium]